MTACKYTALACIRGAPLYNCNNSKSTKTSTR